MTFAGRHDEALALKQQAVSLYRPLAAAGQARYLPALAGALHNLSNALGDMRWWEDGLAASAEVAGIRRLAGGDSSADRDELAGR